MLGSVPNILFHLKTKGRSRGYIDKKELVHSTAITESMKKLTDDELERIVEDEHGS